MIARWLGVLLGATLALGAASARATANCDVSTDQGAIAAYKQATGKDHDKSCIQRSTTFPGLLVIGEFATDRGCGEFGILVGCKWNPTDAAKVAMAAAGWGTADAAKKEALALAWLAEIQDTTVVGSDPGGFKKPKRFNGTSATVAKTGALTLEFWSVAPPGMRPVKYYTRYKVVFAADGTPGRFVETDSTSVPIGSGGRSPDIDI